MDNRKELEFGTYEDLYSQGKNTGITPFRKEFFFDSEEDFLNLIKEKVVGKKVLEIGCGLGYHSIYAAEFAENVVGTDVSLEAIKAANEEVRSIQNLKFEIQDAEKLTYPDQTFDVVINHEVFSSLDIKTVFPELARVLKPKGLIICKETLGHNFVFNFKRKLNLLFGARTYWSVNNIWRIESYEIAKTFFSPIYSKYYHLFVLFFSPLFLLPSSKYRKSLINLIAKIDGKILSISLFKKLAFKTVFVLQKK